MDRLFYWAYDFSGLELHIAAALSGDPTMVSVLTEDCGSDPCTHRPKHRDLHGRFQQDLLARTGRLMDRRPVKTGNFEQLYGGGDRQLVRICAKQRIFITIETARDIVEGHKAAFPGFHRWAAEQRDLAHQLGYASTLYGRRRYLPELRSSDPERVSHGERAAVNHAIQGTAADIVKMVMIRVTPILNDFDAHLAAQTHDELSGWIPYGPTHSRGVDFDAAIKAAMVDVELPHVKLAVEGRIARSWGEAH